jgi:uncharacterized repeat protein (TIGR03803 family)
VSKLTQYICLGAFLISCLAGCNRDPTLPAIIAGSSSRTLLQDDHRGYKLVYAFQGGAFGSDPFGGLTAVKGRLFGTTLLGGFTTACPTGCGTVFDGTKSIYSFKGPSKEDGEKPNGDLLLVGNTLYGTTMGGGNDSGACSEDGYTNGCGTVFAVDIKGRERVVYRFKGGSDGAYPKAGLVAINGTLYGTTYAGGTDCGYSSSPPGCGVVFATDTSGNESVLHRFAGPPDAANPDAALLVVGGVLYGTTAFGGKCDFSNGCGTVFKVSLSGRESVVHSFQGKKDGSRPETPLVYANASLYGVTSEGGCESSCYYSVGGGTLFRMSLAGHETIVHRFSGKGDGLVPSGRLVFQNGEFYGTTFSGGSNEQGTIYSADSSGVKILHSFAGMLDGGGPWGLTPLGSQGQLYGTTQSGGAVSYNGAGTIFRYTP